MLRKFYENLGYSSLDFGNVEAKNIIKGLVYSSFTDLGPDAIAWYPEELDKQVRTLVSVKSIAILSGEEGKMPKSVAVFPFPNFALSSVIFFFEVKDENARGKLRDSSLSLLFDEKFVRIFYRNIDIFERILTDISKELIDAIEKGFEPSYKFLEHNYYEIVNIVDKLILGKPFAHRYTLLGKESGAKYEFKVCLIGYPAVGKTTLILRYVDDAFRELYKPTVNVQITTKEVNIGKDIIRLNLWDVAGQESRHFSNVQLMRTFFQKADAFIVMYDITDKESFTAGVTLWYNKFLESTSVDKDNLKIGLLIGNKIDLEKEREIPTSWGAKLAQKLETGFTEVSAQSGENVNEAFEILARKIYEKVITA
ncbi:MAG: GTP-binding protein [Candidatus Lokiarchaeota archaeon]|nr:GTP-binding protein [Candidatus Lokiarchaeota archaeon]